MPLPKVPRSASKAVKRRAFAYAMHELTHNASKRRPLKQRIAIALRVSGLSRGRRR